MEMWYAYVDGSLEEPARERLVRHLHQCDHCFAQVAEIRTAQVEEDGTLRQTPPGLVIKARRAAAPSRGRWVAYAVAATVVLAVGLQWVYRKSASPYTLQNASERLAVLDGVLAQNGRDWSALKRPSFGLARGRGLELDQVPAPARTAFAIGTRLMQLKLSIEYREDRQKVRILLDELDALLTSFVPKGTPRGHETLAAKLQSAAPAAELAAALHDLQRRVAALMAERDGKTELYFSLALWLENVATAVQVAEVANVPFADVVEVDQEERTAALLAAGLRDAGAPRALVDEVDRLTQLLGQDETGRRQVGAIVEQVHRLEQAFARSWE